MEKAGKFIAGSIPALKVWCAKVAQSIPEMYEALLECMQG